MLPENIMKWCRDQFYQVFNNLLNINGMNAWRNAHIAKENNDGDTQEKFHYKRKKPKRLLSFKQEHEEKKKAAEKKNFRRTCILTPKSINPTLTPSCSIQS